MDYKMMFKIPAFWVVLLLSIVTGYASPEMGKKEADSLENLLKTTGLDSTRVKIQLKLLSFYYKSDTVRANRFLVNMRREVDARNIDLSPELLFEIGNLYQDHKADFNTACHFFNLATDKARKENNLQYLDYQLWLGYTLSRMGDNEQGLKNVISAVETAENMKLNKKLPYSYLILAFTFRNAGQTNKATAYFNKCIESSLIISDSSQIPTALHELGNICSMHQDYSQALAYHKKSLMLREKINKGANLLYSYYDIACDYRNLDSIDLGLEYLFKAEKLAIQTNDQLALAYIYDGIASIYVKTGDYANMLPYLEKEQRLADKLKLKPVYAELYSTYHYYYKSINRYDKALACYEKVVAYKDSMSDEEVSKNISELDKKYELAKKDKELLKKQESIKRQQIVITFSAFIVLLLFGLVMAVFRNYKQKKSAYNKLEIKNQEILQQREEIINAKIEAERSNQAKSEFLSRMSHELRTPMNAILGFAQLMENGELNPKQRKGVSHILSNGRHLLSLINDVLDISGIEAGRQILTIEPVQLAHVIDEVTDSLQIVARKSNVSVDFFDEPSNRVFVLADRRRLKQVLINLLNNAIKYNREGGTVTIATSQQPADEPGKTRVRISISDTGHGIAPEAIGKLFQPFERIGADKSEIEGTGLGLVMVKKITEEMGGSVGVESEVGSGSTFWIELPVTEKPNKGMHRVNEAATPELQETRAGKTILYIEDNPSNLELVVDLLAEHRPEIRLVTSMFGREATALAQEYKPRIIMLDLDLPDINGVEVLEQLLADSHTRSIPVIIVSADAMAFQIEKLMKAGASGYLTKPLDVVQFLKIIDQILSN
jgi:signal transduction histidine kinase/ActR/RegA family two-component response regulator